MTYLQSLLLGIIQGLTEFLPVSSSGHLVLAQQFLEISENPMVFDIFVHFGTLLAVLAVYRKSIADLIYGSISEINVITKGKKVHLGGHTDYHNLRLLSALTLGTIPAVIAGLMFKDIAEELFMSPGAVLISLFITGCLLLATLFLRRGEGNITPSKGIVVGVMQALAIIPGISRSGSTIAVALFLGIEREKAAEFSFLLAIPVIAGATLIALKDIFSDGCPDLSWGPYLVGMLAAFIIGWGSLAVLIRVVKNGKIGYFGLYCIVLSIVGKFVF